MKQRRKKWENVKLWKHSGIIDRLDNVLWRWKSYFYWKLAHLQYASWKLPHQRKYNLWSHREKEFPICNYRSFLSSSEVKSSLLSHREDTQNQLMSSLWLRCDFYRRDDWHQLQDEGDFSPIVLCFQKVVGKNRKRWGRKNQQESE